MKIRAVVLLGGMLLLSSMFGTPCLATQAIASDMNVAVGGNPLISYESGVFSTPASAVPEPVTLSLLGFGLIGLGALGRKKSRDK